MKDIKQFGAKGDGRSDDTAALIEAMKHKGHIYFSDGTYRITRPVQVNDHTRIEGSGNAKIYVDCDNCGLISRVSKEFNDEQDIYAVEINNIEFVGNPKKGSTGIVIDQDFSIKRDAIYQYLVRDCTFHDFGVRGIQTGGGYAGGGIYTHGHEQIEILRCRIWNCGNIGICNSGSSPVIRDCFIMGSGAENITIDNGCLRASVIGCTLLQSGKDGAGNISVDECDGIIIHANQIWDGRNAQVRFNNNTGFTNNGIVAHNTIVGTGNKGIFLGGIEPVTNSIVQGNVQVNCAPNGMQLWNEESRIVMSGNQISDPGTQSDIDFINNHKLCDPYK